MTDLQALLERSVDHPAALDPAADVRRGGAALSRRRRRTVAVAVAAVLLVGVAATAYDRSSEAPTTILPADTGTVRAGGFQLPPPPDGWSVQAADDSRVVIAPDGLPKADFDDPDLQLQVMGKLLVHLQRSGLPLRASNHVERDGRAFYSYQGGGAATQVGVREPSGAWLILQEAPRLHWTTHQMVDYLDEVVVLAGAVPDSD